MAGPEEVKDGGALLWGRVSDTAGRRQEATMSTPEAYHLTVLSALAAVDKVLTAPPSGGFFSPSKAFGAEFAMQLPGVALRESAGG